MYLFGSQIPAGIRLSSEKSHVQWVYPRRHHHDDEQEDNRRKLTAVSGSGPEGTKELLSFNDLPGLNTTVSDVINSFKDELGSEPNGICVNKETYYYAVRPALTEQYGYWCYKILGKADTSAHSKNPDVSKVICGYNYGYNYSDQEAKISVSVAGSWCATDSWDSSITPGISFSESFGIEDSLEMGGNFSIKMTAGHEGSQAKKQEVVTSVDVIIPPHKKCKISIIAVMKNESIVFKVPINVDRNGLFGANYSKPLMGTCYWFRSAGLVLKKLNAEITGTIKCARAMATESTISAFEDI